MELLGSGVGRGICVYGMGPPPARAYEIALSTLNINSITLSLSQAKRPTQVMSIQTLFASLELAVNI
jgi:hypothetical protein